MIEILAEFPPERLTAFLAAGVLLNLTPGADVAFATASGLRSGPRAGMLAGLGVGLGGLWHVGLAAAGLSALLAAHPGALLVLRWAGAGYLLWLARAAWIAVPAAPGQTVAGHPFRRGFVTNALNPKVALFVLAFLPQFTDPAIGPVWQQILMLGSLFALTGALITAGYGALAGVMGRGLFARMGVVNRVAAVIYATLAVRLAWR
jgi:threonine/homoserine/homoserine lactone efflux protein